MRRSETAATNIGMPERLRRLDEIFVKSPIYFVTACSAARKPLLANEDIHNAFKDFAAKKAKASGFLLEHISSCLIAFTFSSVLKKTKPSFRGG